MAKKMCKDCCYWVICAPEYGWDGFQNPVACKDFSKKKRVKCEIITKKKVRRVKAWVDKFDYDVFKRGGSNCVYAYARKLDGIPCYPCTILIDEKWLKEAK